METTYRECMRRYAKDTRALSFTKRDHPDYKALVAMGRDIVPLLIADIRMLDNPSDSTHWDDVCFWGAVSILAEILGNDRPVIPEKSRGRYGHIRRIYLDWYKKTVSTTQAK